MLRDVVEADSERVEGVVGRCDRSQTQNGTTHSEHASAVQSLGIRVGKRATLLGVINPPKLRGLTRPSGCGEAGDEQVAGDVQMVLELRHRELTA